MSALIDPAGWLGNVKAGRTLRFAFFSNAAGVGTALTGTPSLAIYKDASDTQDTDGITLNVSADSVVGLNRVLIDLSADGTFYSAGSDFIVVIAAGTVGATSVVGTVVATFSIENRTIAGQGGSITSTGNQAALTLTGSGSGAGLLISGGASNGAGVEIYGSGEGTGLLASSANGSAAAFIVSDTSLFPVVSVEHADSGPGVSIFAGVDKQAVKLQGSGTGAGLSITGGATGAGVTIAGGATSGNGVSVTTTDGHALHLDATGSNKNDLNLGTPSTNIGTPILDLTDGIESSLTLRGAIRLIAAAVSGKLSGAATTTITIRNVGDSKNRITATVDADGNRTAITTDAT